MFFTDSYQALRMGERRRALRFIVLSFLVLLLIALPVVYFLLRRFEQAVTFHPERYVEGTKWGLPARGEDVWFKVGTGERLHGWFVRADGAAPEATIIYFHGNGGNLRYLGWVAEHFSARGFDVLLFDYRGYGRSEGTAQDERRLYEDADAAYDYVVRERKARPDRLVLYGQSLGTTAAADLAARRECAALILESGLSSASDMAATILPWLPRPVHRLTRNKFNTVGKLTSVKVPVMVAHGDRDEIIPVAQGRALYEAAREPKRLLVVEGAGHNDLSIVGGRGYLEEVVAFIRSALAR